VLIELKRERLRERPTFMDNHWQQFSPIYEQAKELMTPRS